MKRRQSVLAVLARNRPATLGASLLLVIVTVSLLAPLLPLHDPNATDLANRLLRPSLLSGNPLGTDHLGRDLLARLIWGIRLSLAVGIFASIIAAVSGSALGVFAGFFGGRVDNLLMRGVDMLMAFPYILLALTIVAVLGPGLLNALYAVAIVNIPFFARNIRGATVAVIRREFVDAARLSGMNNRRIITVEILPNVAPVIVVAMSTTIGWMILETAGLSFLGLGSQPPQADLGSMLGEGRKLLITAPHASIVPGAMIFIIVIAVNLLGDGIRDILDPRLRAGTLSRPAPLTHVRRESIPEPQSGYLLEVQNLHTHFIASGRVDKAVNGVDIEINAGQCLGIIGESGSGKSVTALSLLGLAPSPPAVITAGGVRLEGEELLSANFSRLRSIRGKKIAYVFQNPLATLHPLTTVGAQISEAIRCHRPVSKHSAWAEAVNLLNQVQIPNAAARARNYPHEMSGGMCQRVSIAMALANSPQLIIADEPTTALDVTVQAQIISLLSRLRHQQNMTLIFVTHDFGILAQLCDRVAVMYAGRIVENGSTEEILANPAHPYTARLIECAPRLGKGRRVLTSISGLPPAGDQLPAGCAFASCCDRSTERCRRGDIKTRPVAATHSVRCLYPLGCAP